MTTLITFPTEQRGFLRAVSFGVSGVTIYDDKVDGRQAIWNESNMVDAVAAMDRFNEFLGVCDTHAAKNPLRVTNALDQLPPHMRQQALKAARARGLGRCEHESRASHCAREPDHHA